MQGYIKKGSIVGQDFNYFVWDNEEQILEIEVSNSSRYRCTANGYGIHGNYGNGAIYAKKENVVITSLPTRENDRAY